MPTRLIREGINSSDRIMALSPGAEILYRRLMSVVDDYGRFYAAPATIRGACWPTCPDKVGEAQVMEWLSECCQGERPLVRLYYVGNCKYLELTDFGQKVRSKSKFPDPCGQFADNLYTNCEQSADNLPTDCGQNASTSRSRNSESKTESNAKTDETHLPTAVAVVPTKRITGSRLDVSELPAEWAQWAASKLGWTDRDKSAEVFESFRDFWVAKPGKDGVKLDWFATWRNWCKEDVRRQARSPTLFKSPESATERAIRIGYERVKETGRL